MNFGAHICIGTAAGAGVIYFAGMNGYSIEPVSFMVSCCLGSILPDIDHPRSYVGRRVPLLPQILYRTVGHRTLTHSILFMVLAGVLTYRFLPSAGIGLALGIGSHIFADIITPFSKGVSIFYPINKKKIGFLKK